MKKIVLSERKEDLVHLELLDKDSKELFTEIEKIFRDSNLSYIQKNKVLHQVDAVLYYDCINNGS